MNFPTFPGYDVEARLGEGSFGVVYAVREHRWGRALALKTLRHHAAGDVYALKREFRVVRDLTHPNLVEHHDLGAHGGLPYFTMERVDGLGVRAAFEARGAADSDAVTWWFVQTLEALDFLGEQGIVHRDVKPGNLMVTREGRLVLLDFGLSLRRGPRPIEPRGFSGTVEYAAPEVLAGGDATTSADAYSAAATFYEVLAGRLPFGGAAAEIVASKCSGQRALPMPGSVLNARAALHDVILALLSPRPAERPSCRDALHLLAPERRRPRNASVVPLGFRGRDVELARLEAAFVRSREGGAVVRVHGPPGIGKTELVRRFTASPALEGAVVLEARCAPAERAPLAVVEGLLDALVEWARVTSQKALFDDLVDGDAARVTFAALQAVIPVTRTGAPAEPAASVRLRADTAFIELVRRAAERAPLVLWLDDAQWLDADSVPAVVRLVRGIAAAPILLVISHRSGQADGVPTPGLDAVVQAARGSAADDVELGPLPRVIATALLAGALRAGVVDAEVERHAIASGGDPYLLTELCAAVQSDPLRVESLADAWRTRLSTLDEGAVRMLELAAVASDPIDAETLVRAARSSGAGFTTVERLVRARLLRWGGFGSSVGVHHDRLAQDVVTALPGDAAREHHRRLGESLLEREVIDDARVAVHLAGAGLVDRAGPHAERAATSALTSLAFDRASRFFRLALEATSIDAAARAALHRGLGEALAAGGDARAAADAFLCAAALSDATGALADRRIAAELRIGSGDLAGGTAVLREALEGVGVRWPQTAVTRLLQVARERGLLALAFPDARVLRPAPSAATERERLALDVLWTAGFGLGVVEPVAALAFQARQTRLALALEDWECVSRGRAAELIYVGSLGRSPSRVESLRRAVERARDSFSGRPQFAFFELCLGLFELYRGRHATACERLTSAARAYGDGRRARWELNYARVHRAFTLDFLGDFVELRAVVASLGDELERTDDRLSGAFLDVGTGYVVDLLSDDAEAAERRVARALEPWRRAPPAAIAWLHAIARARIALYRGRPGEALAGLGSARRSLRSLFVFRHVRAMHGALTMAAASLAGDRRQVRRVAGALELEQSVMSPGVIELAGALGAEGPERPRRAARAAELFAGTGWRGWSAAARLLAHGDPSSAHALGVAEPARWGRLFGVG